MAPSFTYPQNLLHKTTEPQWFPKPREDYESSVDALEAAEEAQLEFLRSVAQKEAPDPVGIATANASTGNTNTSSSQIPAPEQAAAAEIQPEPASTTSRTRFWNQPRTPAPTGASPQMDAPSSS